MLAAIAKVLSPYYMHQNMTLHRAEAIQQQKDKKLRCTVSNKSDSFDRFIHYSLNRAGLFIS